eukprot:gene6440-8861_t
MSSEKPSLSVDSTMENPSLPPSWAMDKDYEEKLLKAQQMRSKSLECSSINVDIISTELIDGHVSYHIEIQSIFKKWAVSRRFRDFYYLDQKLTKSFNKTDLPILPPKRFLKSSIEKEFVDERKELLLVYLRSLVNVPNIWSRNDLVLFLDDENNSMMFLWNFERTRKMQEALNSMSVTNQIETAKLNSDLTIAQEQVSELQDRLARMEMIFLQQATGLATERLSSSVIRSISGHGHGNISNLSQKLQNEIKPEHKTLYEETEFKFSYESAESDVLTYENEREKNNDYTKSMQTYFSKPNHDGSLHSQVREVLELSNELLEEKFVLDDMDSPSIKGRKSSPRLPPRPILPSLKISNSNAQEIALYGYVYSVEQSRKVAWLDSLIKNTDDILKSLSPTIDSIQQRVQIFHQIRHILAGSLAVQLFPVGSIVSNTFLPDSDIDTTAFVLRNEDDSWFVKVNEVLCMSSYESSYNINPYTKQFYISHNAYDNNFDSTTNNMARTYESNDSNEDHNTRADGFDGERQSSLSNISFIHTEIKMIKSMINGVSIDITCNQLTAIYSQLLIEKIDEFVQADHLFKRSLLLVKAWCEYETQRYANNNVSITHSPKECKLSSWAIIVVLIWTFNSEGQSIKSPIQALGHFLRIFASFDWQQYALTITGPLSVESLSRDNGEEDNSKFFPTELLRFYEREYEEVYQEFMSTFTNEGLQSYGKFSKSAYLSAQDSGSEDATSSAPSTPNSHVKRSNNNNISISIPSDKNATPVIAKYNIPFISKGAFPEILTIYEPSAMNIMDPIAPNYNLTRSVDVDGFSSIVKTFQEGYKEFQELCESYEKLDEKKETIEDEGMRLLRSFLPTTTYKLNVFRAQRRIHPFSNFGVSDERSFDPFKCQKDELEFTIRFVEMLLGCKPNQDVLLQIITHIIQTKGPMPVGEIGKNLQIIFGSDHLSKKLKESFGGLKKAIELSSCDKIKVGVEHPFNPNVSLSGVPIVKPSNIQNSVGSFGHDTFLFSPMQSMSQYQQSTPVKEKSAKSKYRKNHDSPVGESMLSKSLSGSSNNGDKYIDQNYLNNKKKSLPNQSPRSPSIMIPTSSPRNKFSGSGSSSPQTGGFYRSGSGGVPDINHQRQNGIMFPQMSVDPSLNPVMMNPPIVYPPMLNDGFVQQNGMRSPGGHPIPSPTQNIQQMQMNAMYQQQQQQQMQFMYMQQQQYQQQMFQYQQAQLAQQQQMGSPNMTRGNGSGYMSPASSPGNPNGQFFAQPTGMENHMYAKDGYTPNNDK